MLADAKNGFNMLFMTKKIQILIAILLSFFMVYAASASAAKIAVPEMKALSTTNAWTKFTNYGQTLGDLVRKKKVLTKTKVSKMRTEFNTRYSTTYKTIQTRKASAASVIEASAEVRLTELYAVVDADFEKRYEQVYTDHEIERSILDMNLKKALKKAKKRLEKKIKIRVGKGKKKRFKTVRFLTRHGKKTLKQQTKYLKSVYAQDVKDLNDRLKDSEEVLEAEYTIELGKADNQLEAEKSAAYEALQATVNAEVDSLNNRKEIYKKHLQRLSGRAESIPNKKKVRVSPKLTKKRGSKARTRSFRSLQTKAKKKVSKKIKSKRK